MACINTDELDSISEKFKELHASLEKVEKKIAQDFRDKSKNERLVKIERSILEIENAKIYAENNITDNELMSGIIRDCDKKLAVLTKEKSEVEQRQPNKLVWSELGFESLQSQIESIRAVYIADTQPPELFNPSCMGGDKGTHLMWPNHVAIDEQTGNIYVSDIQDNRIQLFRRNAEFLRSFNHEFYKPRAILIRKSKLYVIENLVSANHVKFFIFSIDKEQQLVVSDGIFGAGKGQFSIASSLDIDTDDKWYITEPDNKRIQVLNPDFQHNCFFFFFSTFSSPTQIRIRDNIVLVLDNPHEEVVPHHCKLLVLKLDGTWLKNVVLSRVSFAMYFAISNCNHILVSDYRYGALKVFDFDGNLCHIGKRLTQPKGIEVFNDGSVVSLSMSAPCINIF